MHLINTYTFPGYHVFSSTLEMSKERGFKMVELSIYPCVLLLRNTAFMRNVLQYITSLFTMLFLGVRYYGLAPSHSILATTLRLYTDSLTSLPITLFIITPTRGRALAEL